MLLSERRPSRLLDDLDLDAPDVAVHPFAEDSAEEIAPGLGRHCLQADAAGLVGPGLDQGKEGHIRGPDSLEEAVDLRGMPDVRCADDAKDVGRDAVPGEADDLIRRCGDVLSDIVLEEVFGHAGRPAHGTGRASSEIVTIAAGQVAGGAGRPDENLEPA